MYYNDSDQARESGLRRAFRREHAGVCEMREHPLAAGRQRKHTATLTSAGWMCSRAASSLTGTARLPAPALLGGKQKIFETVMTTQAKSCAERTLNMPTISRGVLP